jgi:hypothetical protein
MSATRYALGAASLIVVGGSLSLAAVSIRRRFLAHWSGALARLAEVVVALALLIAILEALGTIGWYALAPIVAASAVVGIGGTWLAAGGSWRRSRAAEIDPAGAAQTDPARAPQTDPGRAAQSHGVLLSGATIAIVASVVVIAEWSAPTLQSYDVGIRTFDSVWYHLPWAASFAQTGHVAPLRFTDIEYLTAFYPATAEMLHGLGIVLFGHDTVSPALNLIWLALSLLAGWCIGRSRGTLGAAAAVLGVALLMATPMMNTSQAGSAANDVVGMFFLLASVAFVLAGERGRPAAVLAAVAAGLAAGVKLSLLAPVFALTVGVIAIAPTDRRRSTAVLWLGPLLLAGGYWYARNLIAVGNPLPWTSLGILPTPAAPLQHDTGFSIAHYLTSTSAWSAFFEPGLAAGLGRWWLEILAVAVVGPILCLLPRAGATVRMLGLVALASLAAYLITPESAAGPAGDPTGFGFNLRYAAPPLALSLAIAPLAPPLRVARRQAVLIAVLVAALIATLIRGSLWPHRHLLGVILLAAALLLAGGALFALRGRAPSRALLVCGAVVLLVCGAAAGYAWQRHYLRGRYQFNPGVSYLSHVWAFFRNVRNARVGVVGTFGGFFSYPLSGLDASNRVQYLGARGPHGSFTAIISCRQWRQAVNTSRLDYVVTTPARDPWHPKRLGRSPEAGWTGSDRRARPVLIRRALGQPIAVYEIRGPLDPLGCGRRAKPTT